MDWSSVRTRLLGEGEGFALPPSVKLPMMPTVVTEFSQKAEDPDTHPKVLAKIVESDTGLTCELLRYINSSAFGLRRPVSSVQQAMMTIGVPKTKLFLLTNGVKQAMSSKKSKWINIQNFWIANLERALFAKQVAKLLKVDEDVSFSASMLQDVLLPILTNELFDQYVEFGNEKTEEGEPIEVSLYNFERAKFRWDHAAAGANVLHGWGFPDEIVCAIYKHHAGLKVLTDAELGKTSVAAVALSALIPDAIRQVPSGLSDLMKLDELWGEFSLQKVAETVQEQFVEMAPGAEKHFTLLRRVEKVMAQTS